MSTALEAAIAKLRSIGDEYCENQMYLWQGFDPMESNPETFFEERGIEFDGELFIRYPVKLTFNSIPREQIDAEERALGATLPDDYKTLLELFGEFHLPGKASICVDRPSNARPWYADDRPPTSLAISSYNETSDGNSIGFVRYGDSFLPTLYEFDHELHYLGDDPSLWTKKLSESLAGFLIEYLAPK